MIGLELIVTQIYGLQREDLERWIAHDWVRPDGPAGAYVFRDIDVARVRLIRELRDDMGIDEDALPVVLSLIDQIYDLRRQLRKIGDPL